MDPVAQRNGNRSMPSLWTNHHQVHSFAGYVATWRSSVNTSAFLAMFASTSSISPGSVLKITEPSEVTLVNLKGAESEGKMGLGEDHHLFLKFSLKALPSGERFSYQEGLDDHQKKHNSFY